MRRSRRSAAALLAIIVTLAGTMATTGAVTVTDPTSRDSGPLAVIGDSLTAGLPTDLGSRLAAVGFGGLRIDAVVSRRTTTSSSAIPSGLEAIRTARAAGFDPPNWLIALGTNDYYVSASSMEQMIDRVLDEIGPGHRVIWVDIWLLPSTAGAERFNAALRRVAARRGELRVADWASVARRNPNWFVADGVHLTGEGLRSRNAFIASSAASLRSDPPTPPQPPTPPTPVDLQPLGPLLGYSTVAPTRVIDTRQLGQTSFGPGETRRLDLSQVIPETSRAAVVNLTAIGRGQAGFLTAWDCSDVVPETSSVNHPAHGPRAGAAVVTLDSGRGICVRASAEAEVLLDVFGAWVDGGSAGLVDAAPTRLVDTRSRPNPAAADEQVRATVPAPPPGGPPALAALVNVTVTGASGEGFVTAWPCGTAIPMVSSLNYVAGRDVANAAWIPLDGDGALCVAASTSAHLIVDLVAVISEDPVAAKYQAVAPVRVIDTRSGVGGRIGRLGVGDRIDRSIVATAGVVSVLETVTVTGSTGAGFVTLGPCAGDLPNVSTLNFVVGDDVANSSVADLRAAGLACHSASATTHLVVDVVGRFVTG